MKFFNLCTVQIKLMCNDNDYNITSYDKQMGDYVYTLAQLVKTCEN